MKKILLTTTETLQGWEIESYLKPLFSNVVVGAGFLSDISAGFTDLFGGRSNSYEKKLQIVNDSALQILQSKASELGANCIIGLKVNVHQISGKNVQMFMVSAYGTAVIAKSITTIKTSNSLKEIDKSTVVDKATLIKLLNNFDKENFQLKLNDLQLIVDNKSSEFKDYIFKKLKNYTGEFEDEAQKEAERLCVEYFSVIEAVDAKAVIYEALIRESYERLTNKLLSIIKAYDLVDYDYCIKLLNTNTLIKKKIALKALVFNKASYVVEDIIELKKLIEILKTSFPNLSNMSTKKGFLSSNEKEVWVCTCNKTNDMEYAYCTNCSNDKYGFKEDEIKPTTVINELNNKALALEELFKSV
jgi:uncharacterized protein YbjQ (UPF0145 family)